MYKNDKNKETENRANKSESSDNNAEEKVNDCKK